MSIRALRHGFDARSRAHASVLAVCAAASKAPATARVGRLRLLVHPSERYSMMSAPACSNTCMCACFARARRRRTEQPHRSAARSVPQPPTDAFRVPPSAPAACARRPQTAWRRGACRPPAAPRAARPAPRRPRRRETTCSASRRARRARAPAPRAPAARQRVPESTAMRPGLACTRASPTMSRYLAYF